MFCFIHNTTELILLADDGEFEPLVITPLSTPPALPDVMKHPDAVNQAQESAA